MSKQIKLNQVAKTMAQNFYNDPLYMHLLNEDKHKLKTLQKFFKNYVGWLKLFSDITCLKDNKAVLVVYNPKKEYKKIPYYFNELKFKAGNFFNYRFYSPREKYEKIKKLSNMLNSSWIKDYVNRYEYLHIDLVVVDKELRGQGYFKRLVSPVLEYAQKENLPVTIETHNKNNVAIYQKYGFKLVKVIDSIFDDLKQYCLINYPSKKP